MRHIILGLSLLIAFPQQTRTIESDNLVYALTIATVATFGVYELAQGIQELAHEQKRKNDLVRNYIIEENKKYNKIYNISTTNRIDQNDLELINRTNNTGLEIINTLYKNNPSIEQIKEKGILVQQEISFEFLQKHNLTLEDLALLVALKQRNYQDIPRKIIDEIVKKHLISEKLSVQPI